MQKFGFLTLIALSHTLYPSSALAYLDPGSSSILVYAVIGIITASLYFLRNWFYKIKLMIFAEKGVKRMENYDLVFHSEGGKYWKLFKPVISELDKQGVKLTYITCDKNDPALRYKSENVSVKAFKNELSAITYMNHLTAKVVVSTTPQLDVYMLKRSKKVQHYVHLIHAPTDIAFYERHALDYYDTVLCSGPHQIDSIRFLEQKRKSPAKSLLETGCAYYDSLSEEIQTLPTKKEQARTVLYAPSWGERSSLIKYEMQLLKPLIDFADRLIVRPHPQMYVSHEEFMSDLHKKLKRHDNVEIDTNAYGETSMAASDILLSDTSGIIFDYAFLFNKPIAVIDTGVELGAYEASDLPQIWEFAVRDSFCRIIKEQDFKTIPTLFEELLVNREQTEHSAKETREKYLFNFGRTGPIAAKQISEILEKVDA